MKTPSTYLGPLLAADPLSKAEQRRLGLLMRRMYRRAAKLERYRERRGPRRFLDAAIAIVRRRGDEARNQLVTASLRLVVWCAKSYLNGPIPLSLDDLVSLGSVRLVYAATRWNPRKGSLATYAMWWMKGAFAQATGRVVSSLETKERVRTCSLNADSGLVVVAPDRDREHKERQEDVHERLRFVRGCFPALSERAQFILTSRFLEPTNRLRSRDDVGRDLNLSGERVRQIEESTLARLRRHVERPIAGWADAGVPIITDRRTGEFAIARRELPVPAPVPPIIEPRTIPLADADASLSEPDRPVRVSIFARKRARLLEAHAASDN